ncbi:MAG: RNA-binding domain-containing protein [Candidatus Caldarchaeum sp.]
MKLSAEITAPVNPTESLSKVLKAVLNIFPKASVIQDSDKVFASFDSVEGFEKLRMLIRSRRIRAAARAVLSKGMKGNSLVFYVNKQAAYVGRLSFYEPGEVVALGPITVKVYCEDADGLVRWLTE